MDSPGIKVTPSSYKDLLNQTFLDKVEIKQSFFIEI